MSSCLCHRKPHYKDGSDAVVCVQFQNILNVSYAEHTVTRMMGGYVTEGWMNCHDRKLVLFALCRIELSIEHLKSVFFLPIYLVSGAFICIQTNYAIIIT